MINKIEQPSVKNLFDNELFYSVPKYQRAYSWGKDHWDKLLNDIISNDEGYFLGTVICVYNEGSKLKDKEYELIDGQQRFTTLSILLLAIYSCLKQYKAFIDKDENLFGDYLNLKKEFTCNKECRLKLQIQDYNSEDYCYLLSNEDLVEKKEKPKNYGNRRISKVFKFYNNKIQEYINEVIEENNHENKYEVKCQIVFDLLKKVNSAIIVMIIVNSNSDAYVLFEALNNSGKPLSAIDLIKNILISVSSKDNKEDDVYKDWVDIITKLSDEYSIQERFFRQYYNSFRDEINAPFKEKISERNVGKKSNYYFGPIATRTTLLNIYDKLIKEDYEKCLMGLHKASIVYSVLMNMNDDYGEYECFKDKIIELERVQAAAAYILLLNLFIYKDKYELDNTMLINIIDYNIKFYIRRNVTDYPNTRKLATIFMNMVTYIYNQDIKGNDIVNYIINILKEESSSDTQFEGSLKGDIYQNNPEATRFLLCYYEAEHFTKEREPDLWEKKDGKNYIWTIEHIFPEGDRIPKIWIDMIGDGDKEKANEIYEKCVHTLGNLTITGYNSSLSNKGFEEKKERKDKNGNKIGYNNGLYINEDIYKKNEWKEKDIVERTEKLVKHFLNKYKL